jgi:hypothetical protein
VGRYYWDQKDTVEDCRSVSISFLRKHGYLTGHSCRSGRISWTNCYGEETSSAGIVVSTIEGEHFVRFYYTVTQRHTGEETDYDYKVALTTTPCNLGGVRYWFTCPLSKSGLNCGRRVAKLYLAPSANYFGCRHCYDLSYESRNYSRLARPGGMYYPLRLGKKIEELHGQIKRWTYRGRPTKKAGKLRALEENLNWGLAISKRLLKE